ncbi:MAG TPA: hypothetical protein VNZ53_55630 [Steroidobacteraceae bacterium]|jgi:hypothetical protein|nr:hypothetical protein [Steroidobacteraceae bacterium]
MMKTTIVTDAHGNMVGSHALSKKRRDTEARVSFSSKHKLHMVEVEDDMAKIIDADEFQRRLVKHIPKQ